VKQSTRRAPSDEPYALAERQREHRLRERVRPKMPVDSNADPWVVASEGLDAVDRLRRPSMYGERGSSTKIDLELVAERLRQLAWGPSPEKSE